MTSQLAVTRQTSDIGMFNYFLKLYSHERWANKILFDALAALPSVPPRTAELIRHIFAAHELWDRRVHGQKTKNFDFWPQAALPECITLNDEYAEKWKNYVRALPAPLDQQTVSFTSFAGKPITLRVVDILTQLHSHSVHHRAQIMLDMKASGLEPVETDYIIYCLQNP